MEMSPQFHISCPSWMHTGHCDEAVHDGFCTMHHPPRDKVNALCRYFWGTYQECQKGEACPFIHELDVKEAPPAIHVCCPLVFSEDFQNSRLHQWVQDLQQDPEEKEGEVPEEVAASLLPKNLV